MTDQKAPTRRKKGAGPYQAAPSVLHSLAGVPEKSLSQSQEYSPQTALEQGRIAERLSLAYQRQACEQRGAMALQAAGLAQHFGLMQRAHLMGGRR